MRLHNRDAFGDDAIGVDAAECQLHPPRFDLRQIEKIVDETHHVAAGRMDVLQVIAITFVAQRPQLLFHHDFCKADDGVQRRAHFMADLGKKVGFQCTHALGLAARFLELALGVFPLREVAQNGAKPLVFGCANAAQRHENRDMPALMRAAHHFAPVVENAAHAVCFEPRQIILSGGVAFAGEQGDETLADHFMALKAKQGFCG